MQLRLRQQALAGLIAAGLVAPVGGAQSAPSSLRLAGDFTAGTGLKVTADQPAHFVVFAIGRGPNGNPVQLLTPATASQVGSGSRVRQITARPLPPGQLGRFAGSDEMVIVALASDSAPLLEPFLTNGIPAADLALSDSAVADGQQLIAKLAASVFGSDVRYTARLVPVEAKTIPLPAYVPVDYCNEAGAPAPNLRKTGEFIPVVAGNPVGGVYKSLQGAGSGAYSVVQLSGCTLRTFNLRAAPRANMPAAPVTTPVAPTP